MLQSVGSQGQTQLSNSKSDSGSLGWPGTGKTRLGQFSHWSPAVALGNTGPRPQE